MRWTSCSVEYDAGGYAALQAGLESVSGPGYWGRALAHHHRTGRSRHWFGLVATLCDREDIRRLGFDDAFRSGEDIELRWRMRDAGLQIGVSRSVDGRAPFRRRRLRLRDGPVLDGRLRAGPDDRASTGGAGSAWPLLPAAAAARGVALSIVHRQPAWIPYFAVFAVANYTGMVRGLRP